MANAPQNPNQKIAGNDYSNQSNQGSTNQGQKGQTGSSQSGQGMDKNKDSNATQQNDGNKSVDANKAGGMKNDPQGSDTRREREEEDRPRADNKVGNK